MLNHRGKRTHDFGGVFYFYFSLVLSILGALNFFDETVGGAVASWLVHASPERTIRYRTLAGGTLLCSWATYLTLTVHLSTQKYKWVPANCWRSLTNWGSGEGSAMD